MDGTSTGLWMTDSTRPGTTLVRDFDLEGPEVWIGSLTDVGGWLYFEGWDLAAGREVRMSDGTTAGTRLVRDIRRGLESGPCLEDVELAGVRGTGYLDANDGINGCELWRSDGSRAGTWMVKDIAKPS